MTTPPIIPADSDFIRHVLMKSNKRCTACQLICFEDEVICPECKAYSFEPYTKHLDNYTNPVDDTNTVFTEKDFI